MGAARPIPRCLRRGSSLKIEDEYQYLFKKSVDVAVEAMTMAIGERNNSLVATVNHMRETYPEKRIFVVAGKAHFIYDPRLAKSLKEYPSYIALMTPGRVESHHLEKVRENLTNLLKEEMGVS